MPFKKNNNKRINFIAIIMAIIMVLYTGRIFSLQISNAQVYLDQAAGISRYTAVIKAQRGEILDRYGREIAVNREGYNIVFNRAYIDIDNINSTILKLSKLLSKNNANWVDNLPLSKSSPYSFSDDSSAVTKMISALGLAHYASADDCFSAMVSKYKLESYDVATQRLIMGVRYSMQIAEFSIANPYTFAEDVSVEIMQTVLESGFMLNGVSVDIVPFREYVQGDLAPHIIGTVGLIDAEEWKTYKELGYSYSDKVGKSGIEKLAEEYLHGTDGQITYRIDSSGNILSSEITKEPIPGKTIVLNLDKDIQSITQTALKETIDKMQAEGGTVTGGAAVMMNVKNGQIYTAATYPSYDLTTYSENYKALVADTKGYPLTNRAFNGIYPPGSTVKPVVAVAALENNKLLYDEHVVCLHTYKYFADYQPSCMGRHGSIGLKTALSKSCNYFFFEMGKRLGITTMTKYFKLFGLGSDTGLDLNASTGLLVEPDSDGLGGDTLQAAIGQMNAFTPLQLATYVSTLANEGTRYSAELINRVVSYDMSKIYKTFDASVMEEIKISDKTISAVKEGMLSVTEDGTGSAVFKSYPIKVGGKTGTSQVEGKADHSVFIAFAPFDNPEIAIAVVLEHGSSGYSTNSVAKSMMDAYFFSDEVTVDTTKPFEVLD